MGSNLLHCQDSLPLTLTNHRICWAVTLDLKQSQAVKMIENYARIHSRVVVRDLLDHAICDVVSYNIMSFLPSNSSWVLSKHFLKSLIPVSLARKIETPPVQHKAQPASNNACKSLPS